jgi:hypothetical protein
MVEVRRYEENAGYVFAICAGKARSPTPLMGAQAMAVQ